MTTVTCWQHNFVIVTSLWRFWGTILYSLFRKERKQPQLYEGANRKPVLLQRPRRQMFNIKSVVAIGLSILLSTTGVVQAAGSLVYDSRSGNWVEAAELAPPRSRGSAIRKEIVDYQTNYKPGTIVIETGERRLYLVLEGGKAMKYGVGVGRDGFTWTGSHRISRKAEWPGWTPPPAMRKRVPDLPAYMEGGPDNPLGARALYIGSTLYRVHGTSEPWSIGQAVSSGCIRLTNEDVTDLYERVKVGALVVVNH